MLETEIEKREIQSWQKSKEDGVKHCKNLKDLGKRRAASVQHKTLTSFILYHMS